MPIDKINSDGISAGGITPSNLSTGAPTWDTNGNVGIGTGSPTYKFDVRGGTGSFSGSSGVGAIRIAGAGGSWFWIDNPTATTMRFSSGAVPGTGSMILDSAGAVVMPNQPAFYAQHNASNQSSGRYGLFDTVFVNRGSHASHGTFSLAYNHTRFTCPVAGYYLVWVGTIGTQNTTTQRTYVYKNGSSASAELRNPQGSNYATSASKTVIVNAAAGDYITWYTAADDNSLGFYAGTYSHAGCLLIG